MTTDELPEAALAESLTILTTPKAFKGIFEVIQTNAITSWTKLACAPEVILFGDDDGTAELAERLRIRHVPEVTTTPEGTPLLSDMFLRGQALASNKVVGWSNADVMFTDRIGHVVDLIAQSPTPLYTVGRRTDIEVHDLMTFEPGWQEVLIDEAQRAGERKPVNWIDYFLFPRGLFESLPAFAIGRPGYDQWLIWHAADIGATVLDASDYLLAIHQRHDYSHVGGRTLAFTGAEAKRNRALVEDWRRYHSIAHARVKLNDGGAIVPARDRLHRLARPRRALAHLLRFTVPLRMRLLGERASWRARRSQGSAGQSSS